MMGMGWLKPMGEPPETQCPHCRTTANTWGAKNLRGQVTLLGARVLSQIVPRLIPLRLWCDNCKTFFGHLHAVERTVIGYHACRRDFAVSLVTGRIPAREWKTSRNDYDWLGEGVYFWEYAPGRAWQWAKERYRNDGAVVASEIHLGRCLDLADTSFTDLLRQSYEDTVRLYTGLGLSLPKNEGKSLKLRRLDRLIIDLLTKATDHRNGAHYQTIRCPFEEGDPVYPGGTIRSQSHIQIAVRDRRCLSSRVYRVGPEGG